MDERQTWRLGTPRGSLARAASFTLPSALWIVCLSARAQETVRGTEPDIVEVLEPAGSEGGTGDLTESISAGSEATPPAVSAGDGATEEKGRTQLSGWARESLELFPYDRGLRRADRSDVLGVPRDALVSHTQLLARASYQRGKWFEATVSGALSYDVFVEGSGMGRPVGRN